MLLDDVHNPDTAPDDAEEAERHHPCATQVRTVTAGLSITRVANACVLLEFGDDAVLTDPYFDNHWFLRLREPIGMTAAQLPRLAAILGGHRVFDHWQPSSLGAYGFKEETPVYVAAQSMLKEARRSGFRRIEVLDWNATRQLSERLTVEVAPAQSSAGMRANSYVLSANGVRVFIGTEARDLEPLRRYRARRAPVDVALLPIDGSALAGHKLVMSPLDAIEASRILGATVLVPIHYALMPIPLLLQTPGSVEQLDRLAREVDDLTIVPLATGRRWTWPTAAPIHRVRES